MLRYLLQLLVWTVFMAVLVLWPAGTLVYPAGWVLIAMFGIGGLAMVLWLARQSPDLLRERMASPLQRAQKPWDRAWLGLFILGFCSWIALMGWDAARAGFTAIPFWLQGLGGVCIVLNGAGTWWTFRENAFAAPVVKIQTGQRTIDTGPYALVRHPMYASTVFLFLGVPLLLGSWLGLVLAVLLVLALAWRTVHEERTLRRELSGYEAYAARVRYRIIPLVW
ncbi:isoprenylcysteine carboxyl methyltransferase [Afipia sp. P52-10]|uniref:methyltransferase family protein n=1 Tax=Afipia sp. P52-10 TaxID=1429916 RepID=UPI0003DF0B15|nr:isoprenylcysteine carboxylmethyltransferase family protein [Afipia sp. P52-10]ETR77330.1 isoprenylcysteine carboxyl methyltransferase [Afipia sp. P52-10]